MTCLPALPPLYRTGRSWPMLAAMSSAIDELQLHEQDGALCFDVKVAPRAARAAISGVHAGALKLSLTAAPVDGAANAALIELLSEALAVPRRALRIAAGAHSRRKRVCVEGVLAAELRAALQAALP